MSTRRNVKNVFLRGEKKEDGKEKKGELHMLRSINA